MDNTLDYLSRGLMFDPRWYGLSVETLNRGLYLYGLDLNPSSVTHFLKSN